MENKPEAVASAIVLTAAAPLAGDYAIILLAGLLGALVALSKLDPGTHRRKWDGAKFVFRSVAIAFAFTWMFASIISRMVGYDVYMVLFPAAFLIGWVGDGWNGIRDRLLSKYLGKE